LKFYDSIGPNPRVVRMFLAEKGIQVPMEQVNLIAGENRRAAHLARNAMGQMPCLELDNGSFLSEVTAICEYLEEKQPSPPLIGRTPEERAETRMWTRRVDLNIVEPMANGFRFGEGLALFKERSFTAPEASAGLKAMARHYLGWLDRQLADRRFIAGERFTLADILLYCFIDFGAGVGQKPPDELKNLASWVQRVAARPSADQSRHVSEARPKA
jgi:glutathione S-transferase